MGEEEEAKEKKEGNREEPREERILKDGRLLRATRKLKSPPCRFLGDEMNFITDILTDILSTGSPEKETTKLKGINLFGCNRSTLLLALPLRAKLAFGERESAALKSICRNLK